MEQWHQKLHNNTSPDDVVICEALLAYIDADLDIAAYWSTLQVLQMRSGAFLDMQCRQLGILVHGSIQTGQIAGFAS